MTQLVNLDSLSPEQLDALQTQIMIKKTNILEQRVEALCESQEKMNASLQITTKQLDQAIHRIDNLDLTNVEGNPQQRLNRMISRYAGQNGITHSAAWKEFRQCYNTAFRTNLTTLIENFKARNSVREITTPEFLTETGHIEDAIRVADKMLNKRQPLRSVN